MPSRGGGPPQELGMGQIGGGQSPQVPGLLQMAQAAMDGGGDLRGIGLQAFGGDPRDTAQVGAPPAYNPGSTQGGYNAVFDPRHPSSQGGWFTMKDYLKQGPTPMEAAGYGGSAPDGRGATWGAPTSGGMQSPQMNPQLAGTNMPSTNNWRLLGNDPNLFMINGTVVNRRVMDEELHPKSVLGQDANGPAGIWPVGSGLWKRPEASYAWNTGFVGSEPGSWGHWSTATY